MKLNGCIDRVTERHFPAPIAYGRGNVELRGLLQFLGKNLLLKIEI